MEDNIQTIIAVIISAFILFIFPVYMAYEKKDDISYALAMRYTQDLVDEVRSKGYITKSMYEDYEARLTRTGNSYDIELSHEYNRYDPIANYYKIENDKYILVKTSTRAEKEEYEQAKIQQAMNLGKLTENSSKAAIKEYMSGIYKVEQGIDKVEDTYKLSSQVYSTNNILDVLNSEKKLLLNSNTENVVCKDGNNSENDCQYAYIMNVGDVFNITIRNTNVTLATVMYNMVTAHTLDSNTRIYVNYGGAILSTKWYGDIDYAAMKHDNISLIEKSEKVVFTDARHFDSTRGSNNPTAKIDINNNQNNRYIIEFEASPEDVTQLREKGDITLTDFSGYNFALGNSVANNSNDRLSVSVGLNGISLIVSNAGAKSETRTFYLPDYDRTIINALGEKQTVKIQRNISEYGRLRVYFEDNQLKLALVGKGSVGSETSSISLLSDNVLLWKDIDRTINNPTADVYTSTNNVQGVATTYTINVSDYTIKVSANRYEAKRQTILSYAASINGYSKIKIEFSRQQDDRYVAFLYVNDNKVAQSMRLETIPKVDIVGKTIIGTEEQYFSGYIRNVKIYEMGD